jgi:POT family proton-dependent oligopeptide transporter
MSSGAALDIVDAAAADYPAVAKGMKDETVLEKQGPIATSDEELVGPNGEQYPTAEEVATLRKVYGKVNWVSCIVWPVFGSSLR